MSPADIITFSTVRLRDGREVKANVEEPISVEPVSRLMAFQMLLGAVLILAEIESRGLLYSKDLVSLNKRAQDLRLRMEDAIEREGVKR